MTNFNKIQFITELTALGERQLAGEKRAADLIERYLNENQVSFEIQKFETQIPVYNKVELFVNGETVEARSDGLVSGTIEKGATIFDALTYPDNVDYPNINYNSVCPAFSPANYYFAPSILIKPADLEKVQNAETLVGTVEMEFVTHESRNILVGNLINPKNVLFCHYDSWSYGALDNASGVAVLLDLIITKSELLVDNLFVLAGNEEIGNEKSLYWGRGYRVFESKYFELMQSAKSLILVDGVGIGETLVTSDPMILELGFPIVNTKVWADKTKVVYNDLQKLFPIYHSELDQVEVLKEEFLNQATDLVLGLLS